MINHVHFGGGGLATLSYVGVLSYIEHQTFEKDITKQFHVSGTSAGAIIAFLVLLGYTAHDLMLLFIDLLKSNELHFIVLIHSFQQYEQTGSFIDLNGLWTVLKRLCEARHIDFEMLTFQNLYELTHREYYVTGTCITRSKTVLFSSKTHPHMFIKQALQITTCIPLCILPIEYDNELYIDGAITDFLDTLVHHHTILFVVNCVQFDTLKHVTDFKTQNKDIMLYIQNILNIIINVNVKCRVHAYKHVLNVPICLPFLDTRSLTLQGLIESFNHAYDVTSTYFKKNV